jgi:hypothetical protein
MKVTRVESFVLRVPTVKPVARDYSEHHLVVARIHTDEGLAGLTPEAERKYRMK